MSDMTVVCEREGEKRGKKTMKEKKRGKKRKEGGYYGGEKKKGEERVRGKSGERKRKKRWLVRCLDELSDVGGHLLDLGLVVVGDVLEVADVVLGDKVDGHTLATETTRATDAVDVVLDVAGKVVVDDEGDLLDVDTTSEKVSGDEDTGGTSAELVHDDVALLLGGLSVGGRDGKVLGAHLLSELVDLSAGVAEDDGLGDGEGLVEVAEGVELVLLAVNHDVELLDTFKGEFIALDEDASGVVHELLGHLEGLAGHGGREEADLGGGGELGEDVIDLILETAREHLVSLVEDEDFDELGVEVAASDHVKDTTGCSDHDVHSSLELVDVITDTGASNAAVATHSQVISKGVHDLFFFFFHLFCFV